jgi:hypothetical protein
MVETIAGIESSQRNSSSLVVGFETIKGMLTASPFVTVVLEQMFLLLNDTIFV